MLRLMGRGDLIMVNTIDCIEKSSEDKQRPTESVKDEPVFIVLHIMNANIMQCMVSSAGSGLARQTPSFHSKRSSFCLSVAAWLLTKLAARLVLTFASRAGYATNTCIAPLHRLIYH